MSTMIQNRLKAPVTAIISPIAKALLRIGVTPDAVTIFGALGSTCAAVYFFSRGDFFVGTLVITFFVLSDLFDGTMARLSKTGSTRWGALIDSTLDRVTDAAIFSGILLYAYSTQKDVLALMALLSLITGALIPYIRARAEGLGISCSVGIAERAERLIVVLVGTGLYGLGLGYALIISLSFIVSAGFVTIVQRLLVVAKAG